MKILYNIVEIFKVLNPFSCLWDNVKQVTAA